ncbi:hypothetical protein COH20_011667 [Aspergillus flavus]|uniref:Uncharacterized protein n=1 Tax=Aspergillus flavus TaxID=5059 RepID=A0AB74CBI2_ASPFL|nr:hypothetical protein NYO67_737 [Aspergillus flavus]RAQ65632.1 hypothetical protein COH20_011667 [Aspergillus flavus]RAQ69830.1 hypothetical protein COH21_000978 [Aspergillus flavus]RMZ43578.1 hypothetical protein CA14_009004 [Aspergillus flavus]
MAAAVEAYVVEINALEANCPTGDSPFSTPSANCGIVAAACQAAADSFAPRCPLQNDCMRDLSWVTTKLVILSKAIFSSIGQACLASKGLPTAADARAMGTGINSLLVAPGLAVTIYHFIELTNNHSAMTDLLLLICYGLALIDEDPETREFFIGVTTAANLTTAGTQLLEAGADA